jgi:hypothetical protein
LILLLKETIATFLKRGIENIEEKWEKWEKEK